jgi:hypothetical protein
VEFLEPCRKVFVGLEVVEDFGGAVPLLDSDVEVREVAGFVVEVLAMLGVVSGVDLDDSVGGDPSVTVLVRDRGDAEFDGRFIGTFSEHYKDTSMGLAV